MGPSTPLTLHDAVSLKKRGGVFHAVHSKLSGQSVKLSDYKNVTDTLFAGKEKKKTLLQNSIS